MFESFKKNSKKNVKVEDKKAGHNPPAIRNYDQFPPEKSKSTGGPDIPFFTFTPPSPPSPPSPTPDQQEADDVDRSAQGRQILLKSNNFKSKSEEGEKSLNKEAKQKMWTQSSFRNKKKNKTEDGRVLTGKKPKSSSKQKEKPMKIKAPKQKNKDNSVIIEFENEKQTQQTEVPSAALTENTETKVSFERKGFQRKSSGGDGPTQTIPVEEPRRLSDVLKVFKIEKERKEKKPKSSCSVSNKADLLMSGESVKDKYISNNFGPRRVEEEDDGSPPLLHFGNIPTDVDLIGNIY